MSEFLESLKIDAETFESDIVRHQREKLENRVKESSERFQADEKLVEDLGFAKPWDTPEDVNSGLSELDLNDSRSISRIYETLKECKQWESNPGTFSKRLVRLRTWIDSEAKFYAEKNWNGMEMPDMIMCSGLFAVMEVYFVPMKYVSIQKEWDPSAGFIRDIYIIDRTKIGKELPSNEDVVYYTFQPLDDSCGVCLSLRGGHYWLRDYIRWSTNWEYVQCDL